ncbi:hypothetical protein [Sulfitobacter sp. 915]|uniref:hypothetical protein n=1 Tax=Sulfitobacter sp. 915 TaxID=3368558 RepID=UPI00374502B6
MKLPLGTIGMGLGILVLLQFMIFNEATREEILQARFVGIIVAILVFVAGALTFWLPRIGGLIFITSAFLAFSGSNGFPELAFWGSASLILGTLSGFLGWKECDLESSPKRD